MSVSEQMRNKKNVIKDGNKYLVRSLSSWTNSYNVCNNVFSMVVTYISERPMLWVATYYVAPVTIASLLVICL